MLVFVAIVMGLTALAAGLAAPPPRKARDAQEPVLGTPVKPSTPTIEETLQLSEPRTVAVNEGDELQLTVKGDELDSVELVGLDQLETIAPETPAVFDLLADRAGTYDIRLLAADRSVGRLRVTPAKE